MHKFALATPLRNEAAHIARLFASLQAQSLPPHAWVIIDDGSDDGSTAELERYASDYECGELVIERSLLGTQPYALGEKYARVVQQGMDVLRQRDDYLEFIAVGINDADCFPHPDYFERLTRLLAERPRLGITSGLEHSTDGAPRAERLSWVRGNCRLWRRECLDEAGYIIGPSADTVSLCKARLLGWDAHVNPRALFEARPQGTKANKDYYGRSAHYRGIGLSYALFKTAHELAQGRQEAGSSYLSGYLHAWVSRAERITDPQIRSYYRWYAWHLIRELPQELTLRRELRRFAQAPTA